MAASLNALMNTIIGRGTAFSGDLETDGVVRIDGYFRGSLKTDGRVIISEDARVEASIRASSVVVGGKLKGSVFALERVDLLPGAVIVGDVFAARIQVDEEATLHGDCRIRGGADSKVADLESFMAGHGGFPPSPREALGLKSRTQEGRPWAR